MTERALMANANMPLPGHLLDPEEKAIWWDRPDPWRYAFRRAVLNIPFSLFLVGFSIFWMVAASKAGGPFWMFGLIFCGAGLWFLSEPLRRYARAGSMEYLLTERRAVIATKRSIESFQIAGLRAIEATGLGRRFGDVLFVNRQAVDPEGVNPVVKDGFIAIADARLVAGEMRRLQAAAW